MGADLPAQQPYAKALHDAGFHVFTADDLMHAMALLRDEACDAVLLDANNERETLLFAAAIERLPEVPQLILMSDDERAPSLSARIGAADLLVKPCTEADVVNTIRAVTNNGVRPVIQFDEPTGQRAR